MPPSCPGAAGSSQWPPPPPPPPPPPGWVRSGWMVGVGAGIDCCMNLHRIVNLLRGDVDRSASARQPAGFLVEVRALSMSPNRLRDELGSDVLIAIVGPARSVRDWCRVGAYRISSVSLPHCRAT